MEFRRINALPPYALGVIDALKIEARRAGDDIIDLGFGNPDIPSPELAVDKLREAAHVSQHLRYSASQGIPNLRRALSHLHLPNSDVDPDPDTDAATPILANER